MGCPMGFLGGPGCFEEAVNKKPPFQGRGAVEQSGSGSGCFEEAAPCFSKELLRDALGSHLQSATVPSKGCGAAGTAKSDAECCRSHF